MEKEIIITVKHENGKDIATIKSQNLSMYEMLGLLRAFEKNVWLQITIDNKKQSL